MAKKKKAVAEGRGIDPKKFMRRVKLSPNVDYPLRSVIVQIGVAQYRLRTDEWTEVDLADLETLKEIEPNLMEE